MKHPNVSTEAGARLQLLARKDESLLIRGDALLILNLCLHVVNSIAGLPTEIGTELEKTWCYTVLHLHIQGDGLASQGLDKDLHREEAMGAKAHKLVS